MVMIVEDVYCVNEIMKVMNDSGLFKARLSNSEMMDLADEIFEMVEEIEEPRRYRETLKLCCKRMTTK
jgi:hypothetical protein